MDLVKEVFSGKFKSGSHVQGIASDGRHMYFSFTTFLLKTDMQGNPLGSVGGLIGHLGCIAYDGGYVYGSLEYKNDSVGKGILKNLGLSSDIKDGFYIVRFDTAAITRMDMDAQTDGVMGSLLLSDVCEDYAADGHRYGCSGIDGITVCDYAAPEKSVYVAYGIYGDTERCDNDNQILLRFSLDKVNEKMRTGSIDAALAARADERLFVYTGNTTYGIQNLEYDPHKNLMLAAVYRGKKPQFANYDMFSFDLNAPHESLQGVRRYGENAVRGSYFQYGSTGIIALGGGYYYFSQDGKDENGYYSTVRLYKESGELDFTPVE